MFGNIMRKLMQINDLDIPVPILIGVGLPRTIAFS